jgi:hypothetical protein
MTGPLVPVGMLNLIRAVLGIHHHRFNLSVKRSSHSECADRSCRLDGPNGSRDQVPTCHLNSDDSRGFESRNRIIAPASGQSPIGPDISAPK